MKYLIPTFLFFLIEKSIRYCNPFKLVSKDGKIKTSESLISTIHAVSSFSLSCVVLSDVNFWNDHIFYTSYLSNFMVTFTCGYFLYDIITVLSHYKHNDLQFLIHGLISFIVYFTAYQYNILHFYGALFLQWELSTPFVNNKIIARQIGIKNKLIFTNDLLILLTFFTSRIVCGLYFVCLFLVDVNELNSNSSSSQFLLLYLNSFSILLLTMYCLCWKWFLLIMNKAIKSIT